MGLFLTPFFNPDTTCKALLFTTIQGFRCYIVNIKSIMKAIPNSFVILSNIDGVLYS